MTWTKVVALNDFFSFLLRLLFPLHFNVFHFPSSADALRIGDMVLFKEAVRGLYLGVEGILSEDVVATDGFNVQESLFCVHLQRQYSASRDLDAFLELYDMDVKSIEDEGAKKFLVALQVWTCLF